MKLVCGALLLSAFSLSIPTGFALPAGHSGKAAAEHSTHAPEIRYEKYKLANGLEVLLHEDHKLPIVSVDIWYHVGPVKERAGGRGLRTCLST